MNRLMQYQEMGVNLTPHDEKSTDSQVESQKPFHLWGVVLVMTSYGVSCWLDGIDETEKALFWFLGDTADCRTKRFHLELGRWI